MDSFTPAQKTANQQPNAQELSGAGASVTPQDALTFLNELETPEASARPPAVANDPAASKPAIVPLQESPQTGIHPSPPPSAPFASEPWGWNTLWSQAARVGITATTSLTKGLESAKSIAEETAKAVVESENVKGIINREHLARLGTFPSFLVTIQIPTNESFSRTGTDISRLTHKLVDTVAPPLPNSPPTPLFADDITLYYSSPADEDLGSLRDFMLATIEEMWVGRVCRRVFIAGREGEQILASNAEEIAKVIEVASIFSGAYEFRSDAVSPSYRRRYCASNNYTLRPIIHRPPLIPPFS